MSASDTGVVFRRFAAGLAAGFAAGFAAMNLRRRTIGCRTVRYRTIRCRTVRYRTIRCRTIRCRTIRSIVRRFVVHLMRSSNAGLD